MTIQQKIVRRLIFLAILSVAGACFPLLAAAHSDVFFTQSEFDNVIRLSYGETEGENWIRTDTGDPSLDAVVTAHKKNGDQIGEPIAVPAGSEGYVDYSSYITLQIKSLKVLFQGSEYMQDVQILNMVFRFEQLKNQNKAYLSTYAVWPNESYPVSTEGGDGWASLVKAYDADKNELGFVDIPDSAKGVADYFSYAAAGIKYLRVTQGGSSSQFFEVEVYQTMVTEPEPEPEPKNGSNKEDEGVKKETAGQEQKLGGQKTGKEDGVLPATSSSNRLLLYLSLILLAGGFCLQFRRHLDQIR